MRKYLPIIILLFLNLSFVSAVLAQNKTATLIIVNQNGEPIVNAKVFYNEGSLILNADKNGQVEINTAKAGTFLRVEATDFEPKILPVSDVSEGGKVVLTKSEFHLGELNVVQIPFGQLEKRRIVGAVNTIKPEEILRYDNSQDVLGVISGRIPGVYGTRDIRGLSNAIVVIDGIPRSSSDNDSRLNMADDLNLLEIEEISVLKDATSKMLYGAKADQGVILITTKRGTPFNRKLKVYAESGIRSPKSYPNYLSASDYMTLYNEALTNDNLPLKYTDADIQNTINKVDPVRYPDEFFYGSDYLKNNSSFYKVNTEASGGNAKTQYFSTLGFTSNGSLMQSRNEKTNASEQLNFRGNVDYSLNKWITASLDAVAVYFTNRYPNGDFNDSYSGNLYKFASSQLPNSFPTLIPADQVQNPELLKSAKLIDGKYLLGGTSQFQNNILGNLYFGGQQTTQQKSVQFNSGLKFDLKGITKGLTAKANFTYDFLNSYTLRQNNAYAVYQPSYILSSTGADSLVVQQYGVDVKKNDQTINGNYFQRRLGFNGTVNYKNTFNTVHHIDATALAYMSGYQIGSTADTSYRNNRSQHFGLRVNYMFKNKYVAEFSGAYVGSPYLSKENRYAFSPSLGVAWILSEEDFLKSNSFVNYLKLKASYGIMNTDNSFSSYRLYDDSYSRGASFLYNNTSGNGNNVTQFQSIYSPDLKFAQRKEFNIGFETSLATNSLWVEANYFNSRLNGEPVIKTAAYPVYLGGFIPTENYNESNNVGFDIALNYTNKIGKLKYTLGTNMVYSLPKLLKQSETQYADEYRYHQGRVSDARFGWVSEGLFKDLDDIANHALQTFGSVQPGDIKYKDLNDDGIINEDDQMQIGNSHARFQYGVTLNLKYKNFEFFALGVARTGSEVYYNDSYYWVYGQRKYSEVVLNRWTPATAETATYPRLTTTNGSNNFRNSTYWLSNNNSFTLNTVQLTYSLPAKYFWKGIQVYARGNSLLTISDTKKQQELNIASSPQMRSYTFGLVGSF